MGPEDVARLRRSATLQVESRSLGVDHDVGIALRLAAAEQGVARIRLACVAVGILDFTRDDGLLASSAVAHAATVVEVEVVGLGEL